MILFGFFGLGPMEIMVLAFFGLLIVGGVVLALVLAAGNRRQPGLPPRSYVESLEQENDQLREENERLKGK